MHTIVWIAVAVYPLTFTALQQIIAVRAKTPRPARRNHALPAELMLRFSAITFMLPYVVTGKPSRGIAMPAAVEAVGLGLVVGGIWLLWRSQTVLGRNWIPGVGLHQKHRLITEGPYSRVRHPIYSAIGLSMFGLAVATGDLMVLLGGACFFAALVIRIPQEEALMGKKFKKKWDRYCEATPAVIPRWR